MLPETLKLLCGTSVKLRCDRIDCSTLTEGVLIKTRTGYVVDTGYEFSPRFAEVDIVAVVVTSEGTRIHLK